MKRAINVSMPSRAYTSFLHDCTRCSYKSRWICVNALSGLYLISTDRKATELMYGEEVSMPSRAYTSFLRWCWCIGWAGCKRCQCPLGLIPHFYFQTSHDVVHQGHCVNALSGLYLISTMKEGYIWWRWNLLCQCPLGLIPHFYGTPSKT